MHAIKAPIAAITKRASSDKGRICFPWAATRAPVSPPPDLTVIADGDRMELGKMYRSKVEFSESGVAYEYLVTTISTTDFFKIVNAARVEMQIGVDEITLTENQLEAWRDLASRMNP